MATKKTTFWNGKNMAGETHAGAESLIDEGARTSPTQAKYQVGNETVSAANLQPSAEATEKITNEGG